MADNKKRFFRRYETNTIVKEFAAFSGISPGEFVIQTGSRLALTLQVLTLSVGATVQARIKNGFSDDVPFVQIMTMNAAAVGAVRDVITDFHNLFEVEVEVTGGTATFALAVSVHENALANRIDIENAEVNVDIDHVADAVGEYDSVRIGDGVDLLEIDPDGAISISNGLTHFADAGVPITPAVVQTLITEVVPVGTRRELSHVVVVCRMEGTCEIKAGGAVIGSGRTGASTPMTNFVWSPRRPIAAGVTIEVKFTARAGAPTSNVEAYLQATDVLI